MAYCTAADVMILVPSMTDTDAEIAVATLVEAASRFIDNYTGLSWVGGTVTGEVQTVRSGRITLDQAPISGIASISVTAPYIGATPTVLVAGTGYQILDPSRSVVMVAAATNAVATVTYTPAPGAVPPDISKAAAMLSAHWARAAVDASGSIFSKIKAGSAELTYREQSETLPLPMDIKAILDGYVPAVAFA